MGVNLLADIVIRLRVSAFVWTSAGHQSVNMFVNEVRRDGRMRPVRAGRYTHLPTPPAPTPRAERQVPIVDARPLTTPATGTTDQRQKRARQPARPGTAVAVSTLQD